MILINELGGVYIMKVAIAQLKTTTDKAENLQKAKEYIAKSKNLGADFVVLPEMFMGYTSVTSGILPADIAEPIDGPFVHGLLEAARQNQIYVVCGMYESEEDEGRRAYNTTVIINKSGELLYNYRKTHLCDAFTYKESDSIIPGAEPFQVIDTEFGKLGLIVCYELRFPEVTRQLMLEKADFLFVSAGWYGGILKEEHWEILIRARAIENTTFVCAANQTGNVFSGRSMIVDPMGVILASAGEEEAIVLAEIDLERVKRVKERLPSMDHRRPKLYSNLTT
jgi:predicted amidohydrolase